MTLTDKPKPLKEVGPEILENDIIGLERPH